MEVRSFVCRDSYRRDGVATTVDPGSVRDDPPDTHHPTDVVGTGDGRSTVVGREEGWGGGTLLIFTEVRNSL